MELTFEQLPQAVTQLLSKLNTIEQLLLNQSSGQIKDADEIFTIQQAAKFLHLTVQTLYGKVHSREIPFSKQGKRLYFSKTELNEWVASGRRKTQSELAQEASNYQSPKKK